MKILFGRRGIVVETKFIGPTNFRGSRVKATCFRGSVTVSYDHSLGCGGGPHEKATRALLEKFWPGGKQDVLAGGESPSGRGYVYIASFPEVV